ncbi:MAG TPA: cytochrome b5 domain-containing protein [Lachnospiraceae bacterium]|nr:cytochrome b5 domain-containing protein [Lachnospiraceae bacterium]
MRKIYVGVLVLFAAMILISCSNSKKEDDVVVQREFTLDELKNYDGQNDNPAYVAVKDVVYDVTESSLWKNGLHSNCSDTTYAGADFTDLIESSPHGAKIMERMPVVGKLVDN